VEQLHECLNAEDTHTAAADALRSIIDEIRLVPQDGALAIDLYGELSALLALRNDKAASGQTRSGRSTVLVAGARNCLYLLLFAGGLAARSR
jgi:site-specific DNA recombinase